MYIFGISGGIGSGKTTVAGLFREAGLTILDADAISHTVTSGPGPALLEIVEVFGPDILDAQGGLDREKMADLVFRDKKLLDQLTYIVHQAVMSELDRRLTELEKVGCPACVLDVPIPVKHGFLDRCNKIIIVTADRELRLARLADRGIDRPEAERRMAIQLTDEEYLKLADYRVVNNGDFDDLKIAVNDILKKELADRGIAYQPLA